MHAGGKLGVLVALDAAASGDRRSTALAKDLAMHVAAADPSPVAVDRDGVPAELLDDGARDLPHARPSGGQAARR